MQSAVAVLPELPRLRDEPVAGPPCGPWDRAAREGRLGLRDETLELIPAGDRLALPGGVRADLRVARPSREVRIRLGVGNVLDPAFDAHLTSEWIPVEEE